MADEAPLEFAGTVPVREQHGIDESALAAAVAVTTAR